MNIKPRPVSIEEMSEFDADILGRSAVRINIPMRDTAATLDALRKFYRVTERAIVMLETSKVADEHQAMFNVKSLLRGCAMSIARVKRRRF